jgi:hypothetical protein
MLEDEIRNYRVFAIRRITIVSLELNIAEIVLECCKTAFGNLITLELGVSDIQNVWILGAYL